MPFAKLDRELIIREAVALLTAEGLEAVSLRRVASRLGVSVSSLYWHVADKNMLYGLMSMSIFRGCLEAVPPADDWRQWLHGFGIVLWDAQTSIPDARQLIMVARPQASDGESAQQHVVDALAARGLPPDQAMLAQRSVQALVTGWTTLRSVRPDAVGADRDSFIAALATLIDGWQARLRDPERRLPDLLKTGAPAKAGAQGD